MSDDKSVTAEALMWMATAVNMRIERCCEVDGYGRHHGPDVEDRYGEQQKHAPTIECDPLPPAAVLDRVRVLTKQFSTDDVQEIARGADEEKADYAQENRMTREQTAATILAAMIQGDGLDVVTPTGRARGAEWAVAAADALRAELAKGKP